MNVFNIQEQYNVMLSYTAHAVERAEERKVPLPSYVPFNSELLAYEHYEGGTTYSLCYKYLGIKYVAIITNEMIVLTVYRFKQAVAKLKPVIKQRKMTRKEALKQYQRVKRVNKSEDYYTFKDGKYPHLEYEIGYDSYFA